MAYIISESLSQKISEPTMVVNLSVTFLSEGDSFPLSSGLRQCLSDVFITSYIHVRNMFACLITHINLSSSFAGEGCWVVLYLKELVSV